MGYSKEAVRQNEALKDLLAGREHTKNYVQVGYEGKKEPQGDIESHLTKIMKDVRMPWFCPECKKTMKKKLDDKFWRMMGHCFDCQIEMEHKLRVKGEYEDWAKKKVLENKKSYFKDLQQSIEEFEKQGGKQTWLNNVGVQTPELEKEEWAMGEQEFEKVVSEAKDYLKNMQEAIDEEEKLLNTT